MTKKDYIKFAELVCELKKEAEISPREVEDGLLEIFIKDNPRFDLIKWQNYILKKVGYLASKR